MALLGLASYIVAVMFPHSLQRDNDPSEWRVIRRALEALSAERTPVTPALDRLLDRAAGEKKSCTMRDFSSGR